MSRRSAALAACAAAVALCVTPASGALYVCGCDTLRVEPVGRWEAVVLYLDGGPFLLPQTIAASGVRYSDGERTFWTKGEEAFLEIGDVLVKSDCVLAPSVLETGGDGRTQFDVPVLSSHDVDVSALNELIDAAALRGEAWVRDAFLIALEHVGATDGLEARVVSVVKVDSAAEAAAGSTVTVVREGLLDDSVRAIWDELHLARTAGGAWRVERALRAYRCWRGHHGLAYGAEWCP